jgi:predicted HD superfamily hydrolase involved in NAD metabolism
MNLDQIKKELSGELDEARFIHSVNVMEESVKLAHHYGVDPEKAAWAGLLHDCGKNYKGDRAREYARSIGYTPDEIENRQTKLLHGIIGEHLAREKYGVTHPEILSAIRWHTTGRGGMSLLEKIIYIADYIEPARQLEGIEEMRKVAYNDLDRCIVICSDSTIDYILKKGNLLHPKTVETRNHSLMLLAAEAYAKT